MCCILVYKSKSQRGGCGSFQVNRDGEVNSKRRKGSDNNEGIIKQKFLMNEMFTIDMHKLFK